MYNTDLPNRADLPTSAELLRSTIVAALGAIVILVAVVLPADYGVDVFRIGRLLGLTDMGETKVRLAAEAEADLQAAAAATNTPSAEAERVPQVSSAELAQRIASLERAVQELVRVSSSRPPVNTSTLTAEDQMAAAAGNAAQPETSVEEAPAAQDETVAAMEPAEPELKSDSVSFMLNPGQGVEIKLVMKEGAQTNFAWASEGGPVNFDTHGDGPGDRSVSYEKGRGVEADNGTITAAFDGNHGWFWRNRGQQDVKLTLNTRGYYTEIKGVP